MYKLYGVDAEVFAYMPGETATAVEPVTAYLEVYDANMLLARVVIATAEQGRINHRDMARWCRKEPVTARSNPADQRYRIVLGQGDEVLAEQWFDSEETLLVAHFGEISGTQKSGTP